MAVPGVQFVIARISNLDLLLGAAWGTLGSALLLLGGGVGGALGAVGANSHLWGDDIFLAGFALSCLIGAAGVYVLLAAFFGRLGLPALLLYAGSIAWVIGYDTIYAHQDREDDALVGIKSTALLFGERTKPMLALFYAIAVILIGAAGFAAGAGAIFGFGLLAFAAHLCWQVVRLDIGNPDLCLAVFKSDRDAGLILFTGLLADAGLRQLV